MSTAATAVDDLAGQLERTGEHFNRNQWVWFETDEVDAQWEARIGYLEDPTGMRLQGFENQQQAIDAAQDKLSQMVAERQEELRTGFDADKAFVIKGTEVTCRPNPANGGWHVGFKADYGHGLYWGPDGKDRTPEARFAEFEDACMLCCLAEQKQRKTKLPNYFPEMTGVALRRLGAFKLMADVLGEAMFEVLTEEQQLAVVDAYNEKLRNCCAGI